MITPPVPPEASARQVAAGELSVIQKLVKADKSAVVAAVVHVAVLLVAALGLRLSAPDVAILGAIVSGGLSYFVSLSLYRR